VNNLLCPSPLAVYKQRQRPGGNPRAPSIPFFLVSETTHAPVGAFLQYMHHEGAGWSLRTKESYVDCLKDFSDYLDAGDIALPEIDEEVLKGYLNSFREHVSPVTEREYEASTVAKKISVAKAFAMWASNHGLLQEVLPVRTKFLKRPRASNEYAHLGAPTVPVLDVAVEAPHSPDSDQHVNIIDPDDLWPLFGALGEIPDEWRTCRPEVGPVISKDRLMAELALSAGLRRAEVCGLPVRPILAARLDLDDPLRNVSLRVKRKGGEIKTFLAPTWIVYAMQRYATTERSEAVNWAKAHRKGYVEPYQLFVNGMSARRNRGGSPSLNTVDKIFLRVQKALNLVRLDQRNSTPRGSDSGKYRFHDLRHTYAVWTYIARKAAGDAEPWVFISRQLGHKDVSTTIAIYANPVKVALATASERFYSTLRLIKARYG
jgi:site-specific recombinase XerD